MKKIRKIFVYGIIILFFGAGVTPGINGVIETDYKEESATVIDGNVNPTDVYILSILVEGCGWVDALPPGKVYLSGTVVQITAMPCQYWEFSHWSGDIYSTCNPTYITMDSDKSITAHFWYTLPIEIVGCGNVIKTPDDLAYPVGDNVELTAIPDEGWEFADWSGDISSSDNPAILIVHPSMTEGVIATFTKLKHDVGVKMITEPSGTPEPWPTGSYPVEAVVKNYGTFIENDFNVTARIWELSGFIYTLYYEDVVQISEINPDDEITVSFENVTFDDPPHPAPLRGWYNTTYLLEIYTELDNDEDAENDRKTKNFTIEHYYTPQLIVDIDGDMGENGWFISEVIISMYVDDPYEEYSIMYKIDDGEWILYTEPFVIYEQGHIDLYCYCIDSDGNTSAVALYSLTIDYSKPEIGSIRPEKGCCYLFGKRLFKIGNFAPVMIGKNYIDVFASDADSDIRNISFSLVKGSKPPETYVSETPPYVWELTERHMGRYTLTVTAYNSAGLSVNATLDLIILQLGIL